MPAIDVARRPQVRERGTGNCVTPLGHDGAMFDTGASTALEQLVATDISVADQSTLSEVSAAIARLQAFVDHAKVQVSRRTRQLAEGGDRSAEHVLLDEGRLSGKDARATSERDRLCESLPEFDEALATGTCTGGHLDALARHTKDLTDEERSDLASVAGELLDHAATEPAGLFDRTSKNIVDRIRSMHRPDADADELDRQRALSKVKRWVDRDTGMNQTLISLDPLRDASLWTAIEHHLARIRSDASTGGRPFRELQVEAVMAALSTSDGSDSARIPEVVLHVDAASACHGRHGETLSETIDGVPIPVSTAQRLCCDAVLQAVVVRPDGTVDQLCAERRTASRQQRRLLAAMYRSCAHPHCEIGFASCRIHHIEWFSRGGKTVVANLLPLCEQHHHLVHEGGWGLSIDDERRLTWLRPNGDVWLTDDGPNRTVRGAPGQPGRPTNSTESADVQSQGPGPPVRVEAA